MEEQFGDYDTCRGYKIYYLSLFYITNNQVKELIFTVKTYIGKC